MLFITICRPILCVTLVILVGCYSPQRADLDQVLISSVVANNPSKVREALRLGANPNALSSRYMYGRCLELALDRDNTHIVRILLENKADPNLLTPHAPKHILEHANNIEQARLLIKSGATWKGIEGDLLSSAIDSDNAELLKFYLDQGMNSNTICSCGYSPMRNVLNSNALRCCSILLKNGYKVDAIVADNFTALEMAIMFGYSEMVEVLLKAGASFDVNSPAGKEIYKDASPKCKAILDGHNISQPGSHNIKKAVGDEKGGE